LEYSCFFAFLRSYWVNPNKAALCLLSFFLTIEKTKLSGNFITRNNFSTCGDGSVIFQKIEKEPEKKIPIKA
jgi:hypothetical protein